jgi:hypothetical protein
MSKRRVLHQVPLSQTGENWNEFQQSKIEWSMSKDVQPNCYDVFDLQFLDLINIKIFRFSFEQTFVTDAFKRVLMKLESKKDEKFRMYFLGWLLFATNRLSIETEPKFKCDVQKELELSEEEMNTFKPKLQSTTSYICDLKSLPNVDFTVRFFTTIRFELQTFIRLGSDSPILKQLFPSN